jgi:hypothetical protein
VSVDTIENQYDLVFEGPSDDSPATLSRIKSAFIAELDFSIPQVQQFLSQLPVTLRSSANPAELESMKKLLTRAGANVLVVRRSSEEESEEPGSLELNIKLEDMGISIEDEDIPSLPPRENVYVLPEVEDPAEKAPAAPPPAGKSAEELMASLLAMEPGQPLASPSSPPPVAPPTPDPLSAGESLSFLDQPEELPPTPPPVTPSATTLESIALDLSLGDKTPISDPSPPPAAKPSESAAEPLKSNSSGSSLEALSLSFESADEPAAPPAPSQPAPPPKPAESSTLQFSVSDDSPAVESKPKPEPSAPVRLESLRVNFETDTGSALVDSKIPALSDNADDGSDLIMAVEHLTSGQVEAPSIAVPPQELQFSSSTVAPPASQTPRPTASTQPPPPTQAPPLAAQRKASEPPSPQAATSGTSAETEESLEAEEEEETSAPKRRRGLSIDTIVITLVAGTLLGLANWFYFTAQDSLPPSTPVASSPKAEDAPAPAPQSEPVVPVAPTEVRPPVAFKGSARDGGVTISGNLIGTFGTVSAGQLVVETAPPAPLTDEEIVRKVVRAPWITKVELDNLLFTRDETGSFVAKTPAKVYVDYAGDRMRIMGSALIRVSFPISAKRPWVYLEVSDSSGLTEFTAEQPRTSAMIAPSNDGLFTFSVTANMHLQVEATPQP